MEIRFGTDGWRGVIAKDYTYENVSRVLQAFCDLNRRSKNKTVLLGYDRRFSGKLFAECAAQVLLGNGFKVLMADKFCPTPCISWMTKQKKALAGVVITASHNPFQWNGVKFKEADGGAASPEYTDRIEARIIKNLQSNRKIKRMELDQAAKKRQLNYFDPHQAYLNQLSKMVDVNLIKRAGIKILADPIYGAGSGYYSKLFPKQVVEIRGDENPGFGGVNPEPIEKNLKEAAQAVRAHGCAIGLATDGDADRIGALDEKGRYVNSHQIYALILRHLVEIKKWRGRVIKTVSTTEMVDRLGKEYGLEVFETPIGFKHICEEFRKHDTLMGGEESGGIGISKHVYERDGILSGLILLEIIARAKQPFSKIIAGLQKQAGPLYYQRLDLGLAADKIKTLKKNLKTKKSVSTPGFELDRINKMDGFKFHFADKSWLLIRPSGTEPLLRVYAEAPSKAKMEGLIALGQKLVKKYS